MQRDINFTSPQVVHVISEPGDATRYEFAFLREPDGDYIVWPERGTTINYPSPLPEWIVAQVWASVILVKSDVPREQLTEIVLSAADILKVNPFTLLEVVTAIMMAGDE